MKASVAQVVSVIPAPTDSAHVDLAALSPKAWIGLARCNN